MALLGFLWRWICFASGQGTCASPARPEPEMRRAAVTDLLTIGYQGATVHTFLRALTGHRVELLVDVRAVASSRRPGFSKSALAANLQGAGIDYLHLRGLGTPAPGRVAARAGRHEEMRKIFQAHLATLGAREELESLADIVRSGRRVCLLCFETDPAHCHRSMVAIALAELVPVRVTHLTPPTEPSLEDPDRHAGASEDA